MSWLLQSPSSSRCSHLPFPITRFLGRDTYSVYLHVFISHSPRSRSNLKHCNLLRPKIAYLSRGTLCLVIKGVPPTTQIYKLEDNNARQLVARREEKGKSDFSGVGSDHKEGTHKRKMYVFAARQTPLPFFLLLLWPGAARDTTVKQCLGLLIFCFQANLYRYRCVPAASATNPSWKCKISNPAIPK